MSTTRETGDLVALATQTAEHLAALRALRQHVPPEMTALRQAVASTRTLRGSASLLGLDPFQAFLGRLLQMLEDVESGALAWSQRVDAALGEAERTEALYGSTIELSAPDGADVGSDPLATRLLRWRRPSTPPPHGAEPPSESMPAGTPHELEAAVEQLQRLRQALDAQTLPAGTRDGGLATLAREIAMLQTLLERAQQSSAEGLERPQEGLRNHCEGALHHLVEAAAREVLEEARERGLRLGLRVTGALDPIDGKLGAVLLEVLSLLWSDCLEIQVARGEAQIDTVLRSTDGRLVVEMRDAGPVDAAWRAARSEDDTLGCYPGLRRARPLVESVHGLVAVEPEDRPGCRFWLSFPASVDCLQVVLARIGEHDVAIPVSAVEAVLPARTVRAGHDAAGTFVEIEGQRIPVLHLAFLLGDIGYDELVREQVLVVGSFERRAALFVSRADRTASGRLMSGAQGLWAGSIATDAGLCPMLHVGAVLGRCAPAVSEAASETTVTVAPASPAGGERRNGPATILVVDGLEDERLHLAEILSGAGHIVRSATTLAEAWGTLENEPVDAMLCDLRLPEMSAQQIAERRRQTGRQQQVPMILVLTHPGEQSHLVVQQLGATAWVRSPVVPDEVLEAVGQFVRAS